jgi:hypothetical protein
MCMVDFQPQRMGHDGVCRSRPHNGLADEFALISDPREGCNVVWDRDGQAFTCA